MPIDYSKWDKIEISDDSDIEVHPNVDKRSFIKWKQQSIHEKRAKRNQDIKNLEFQVEMYGHLNKRVDKLMAKLTDDQLLSPDAITRFLNENFDRTEKGAGENVDPDMPPYNEMVEDLFEQLEKNALDQNRNPKDGAVIREMMQMHREKIKKVTEEAKVKLEELYKEKSLHISSDEIHTGFDRSIINKSSDDDNNASKFLPKNTSSPSLLSSSDLGKLTNVPLEFIDYKDDTMKLAKETEEFGAIPVNNYKESEQFLLKHLPILSEQQKDALMMKAFEYQMAGEEARSYQIIHQSELMSYVREIYAMKKIPYLHVEQMKEVITVFFQKVFYNLANQLGKRSFLESVQTKFDHVRQRCKVLEKEQVQGDEQEGVETIQLKSLDESTELKVNLPDFESKDPAELKKVEAFKTLPTEMQEAVKTQSLDKINEVFATMSIEDAENVLGIFDESEIIGINALLENESEFQELQEQYNNEKCKSDITSTAADGESNIEAGTADIVD